MAKKTATADQFDANKAPEQQSADLQEQLFALAFHVHAAIRRCDEVWEQAKSDHERAAVAVFARQLRDDLRAAVSGAQLPAPPPSPVAAETDNSVRALQVCGMLALLLAHKHPKFKTGTVPNAAAIAASATEVAVGKVPGWPLRGLGNTNVRTTISRAVGTLMGTPPEDRPDEHGAD